VLAQKRKEFQSTQSILNARKCPVSMFPVTVYTKSIHFSQYKAKYCPQQVRQMTESKTVLQQPVFVSFAATICVVADTLEGPGSASFFFCCYQFLLVLPPLIMLGLAVLISAKHYLLIHDGCR
jgi:hypothetical protein